MNIEVTNKETGKQITIPKSHVYTTDNVSGVAAVGIAGTKIYFDVVETYEEVKALLIGANNVH